MGEKHDETLLQLRRDVRRLQLYAGCLTLALAVLTLAAFKTNDGKTRQEQLDVQRINIVDDDGTTRLVISNQERFPGPKGASDTDKSNRIVTPAGMVFYDRKGKEIGGIALTDTDQGKLSALLFDYGNMEATGVYRRIDANGNGSAAFFINDAAPADMPVKQAVTHDWSRIKLQNPDRNAEILLTDTEGRNRIQLRVDKAGEARIEILDKAGKVVFKAPGDTISR